MVYSKYTKCNQSPKIIKKTGVYSTSKILLVTLVIPILFILSPHPLYRDVPSSQLSSDFLLPNLPKTQEGSLLAFLTVWNTELGGTIGNNQIHLPLIASGNYNFLVKWGDNTSDVITSHTNPEVTHSYE